MPEPVPRFFLPGWGAPAGFYRPGMPGGWVVLEPPGFRRGAGLEDNVAWVEERLEREGAPAVLAGHSMGGALALLAAAARPELVRRLVLFSPAGLPLSKPLHRIAQDFLRYLVRGFYPPRDLALGTVEILRAPRSAAALAARLRGLDLANEMTRVREAGVPAAVVACATDTLVTPSHCRRTAELLGAEYREVGEPGGHVWMLRAWPTLAAELRATTGE